MAEKLRNNSYEKYVRRIRARDEFNSQCGIFKWASYRSATEPRLNLMFAIPNGGLRNRIVAARLKASGVKPGVPDLMLACPVKPYHGLFIEMKSLCGRISQEQLTWLDQLEDMGYAVAICRGLDEAIRTIENYLKGEKSHTFCQVAEPGRLHRKEGTQFRSGGCSGVSVRRKPREPVPLLDKRL